MHKIIEKWSCLPKGMKASLVFFLASIVSKGVVYLTTPIYTRLLTSEQYGQASLFFTWLQIFGIIAMFCLSAGVFNNGMIEYSDKRDEYSYSMLTLSNLITIIWTIIIWMLYPYIHKYIGIEKDMIILMSLVFFFQPAYNFWITRQRYELKYKSVFIGTVVVTLISAISAVLCIYGLDNKLYGRIFGAEVPLIIIYVFFYVYIANKSKFKAHMDYWKFAIKFNLPLIPHYLSTYLLTSADTLMISYYVNRSAVAYYSVAYSVAAVVTIVWTAINGALVPFTYENCKKENYQEINKVVLPLILLFAVCCVGLTMLAPEVVMFMASNEYMEAIYVIPPIVGGIFFQVQYYIYANIVYYYKKTKYVMFGSITAMLLNVILNYLCINKWGYLAAGYVTLVCYIIQAIIDYWAMKRVVKQEVYNMKFILALSTIVLFISLVSGSIYDKTILRYIILIAVFVCLIINKDKIKRIIKTIKT